MTPTELATEASTAANKTGQDRVATATIISRGKRLYQRKRLSIHHRWPGKFYRTRETFTMTAVSNVYTPASTLLQPILVERNLASSGSTAQYGSVKPWDPSAPDSYFGWAIVDVSGVKKVEFSQAGQAAGDYRLTYLAEHAIGDSDQMVLPTGYEDVLVSELGAWLRRCYEEDGRALDAEARALEDELDTYWTRWNGVHPTPGLTNG